MSSLPWNAIFATPLPCRIQAYHGRREYFLGAIVTTKAEDNGPFQVSGSLAYVGCILLIIADTNQSGRHQCQHPRKQLSFLRNFLPCHGHATCAYGLDCLHVSQLAGHWATLCAYVYTKVCKRSAAHDGKQP